MTPAQALSLFGDSDSEEDEVVEDTQRAAGPSAMPAVGRVVAGLRAPAEGRAPPDAPAPSPPSQADAATQEGIGTPKPLPQSAVLEPWPEESPENMVCQGCAVKFQKKSLVGICPDCKKPVHNNNTRTDCIMQHPGTDNYACAQCVKGAGRKATSRRFSSVRSG